MDNISADKLIKAKKVRYWEKVSFWFATAMLLVLPLFLDNTLYYYITEAKWHSFLVMAAAYIAVCVLAVPFILGVKEYRVPRLENGRQKLTLSQIILLVYFGLSCISALLSEYPAHDLFIGQSRYEGLLSLFLYLGLFFCLSFWGEYNDKFFYIVGITSIAIGLFAIPQLFGSTIFYPDGYSYYNTQFLSTIGNVDCVSGVISCAVPIMMCAYVLLNGKARYIFPFGVFVMSFTQFAINVDAGKVAFACAFAITLPFLIDHRRKACRAMQIYGVVVFALGFRKIFLFSTPVTSQLTAVAAILMVLGLAMFLTGLILEKKCSRIVGTGKRSRIEEVDFDIDPAKIRKYAFYAIGAAALACLLFLFVYTGENKLLHELHEATHLRLSDDAGSGRGIVYKNCIKLIAENPLFGTGPGTFMETYYPYNEGIVFDFAHCDLLQIAVSQGLLAMIAYIAFLVSIAIRALKNAHKFYPIVIMGSALVGFICYSFLTFSIAIVSPTFWIMAGILDKTVRQLPAESTK